MVAITVTVTTPIVTDVNMTYRGGLLSPGGEKVCSKYFQHDNNRNSKTLKILNQWGLQVQMLF